jgi:two-component system NarL family sensor kinase
LFELLHGQSPGCAWPLKRNRQFHAVDGDALRVFGRAARDLPGSNFADLVAANLRSSWVRRVERVFSGETLNTTAQFSETAPCCSVTLFPVRASDSEISYAGGIAQELAESGLALRTLRALEADRARLSRLLHDHVGQSLSAAGLQLDLLRLDLAEGASPFSQRIGEIQGMLEGVMDMVRDFSYEWNPTAVERVGLAAALNRLARQLRLEFAGSLRVVADLEVPPPSTAVVAFYRIAQEAARNAVRHSGCSAIEILLKSMPSGPVLEIRDNGRGFDSFSEALRERGLGLWVMQEYADRAGIHLRIDSAEGKGTSVRAFGCYADKTAAG